VKFSTTAHLGVHTLFTYPHSVNIYSVQVAGPSSCSWHRNELENFSSIPSKASAGLVPTSYYYQDIRPIVLS